MWQTYVTLRPEATTDVRTGARESEPEQRPQRRQQDGEMCCWLAAVSHTDGAATNDVSAAGTAGSATSADTSTCSTGTDTASNTSTNVGTELAAITSTSTRNGSSRRTSIRGANAVSTSTSRASSKGPLKVKLAALSAFALAYGTADNPVDPTPENFEKWLDNAYPKDKYGNSIRHQIDCTAKEHKQ